MREYCGVNQMKIVYALAAYYPFGSAYASRVLNFCRLLSYMGHEPIVFCDYLSNDVKCGSVHEAQHEGVKVHFLTNRRTTMDKLTVMYRTPAALDAFLSKEKVDVIITSSSSNRFNRVRKVARKHKTPLLLETCEKYHHSNWRFGKYDYRYYQFMYCWKHTYRKADGIIAISSYLRKHFDSLGLKTVRIPTIMDVSKMEWRGNMEDSSDISFIFAGGLGGGKDRLVEFIEAMYRLQGKTKRRAILNIYGPSKADIAEQLGDKVKLLDALSNVVNIKGRIPQEEIPEMIRQNDFGIILRPQRESSHAGFPTKLAEYMSVGTPVLANRTSDIEMYLHSGENGFLLKENTVDSVTEALKMISELDIDEMVMMRNAARRTAEKAFDFRVYCDQLQYLLDTVITVG